MERNTKGNPGNKLTGASLNTIIEAAFRFL
jgi:hypothetical protein